MTSSAAWQLNNARPAFVVQVSCMNGYPESGLNLGYSLLQSGAVGTISSSRLSYYVLGAWSYAGDPGLGDNATLAYQVLDRMTRLDETIGEALAYYRAHAQTWGSVALWQNMLVSNLYGDPALALTSSNPGCTSPPTSPSSPSPSNTAKDVALGSSLAWSQSTGCSGDTVTYDVYLGTNGTASTRVCTGTQSTTCNPGELLPGTTYSWRVVAKSSTGETQSPLWSFTTEEVPCSLPPAEPTDPSPAHGQVTYLTRPQLEWCGGHSCAGESVTYEVYLSANTMAPTTLVCSNVQDTRCDPGLLQPSTQYAWQVVAVGMNGPVTGPVWTFQTHNGHFAHRFYVPFSGR
jgi:hypothetical protein